MDIVIYGAQSIALGTYRAIKELFPTWNIRCFLVTELKNNPSFLEGVPVRELADFVSQMPQEERESIEVLIATPEDVMEAIEQNLDKAGLCCHVRIHSMRWAKMQELALLKSGKFMPLSAYPVGHKSPTLKVYKAKFYKDKKLTSCYTDPPYICELQVGASKTSERVANLLDNTGDHISEKNGNYSELTGLYWIWKNVLSLQAEDNETYIGLAHYRRLLQLSEDDLLRIKNNDIDVILPYPMPYEPNMEMHHKRYLSQTEWDAVLQALKECDPDSIEAYQKILQQEYMYNYNIVLAKSTVLKRYCAWLFPILFRVEKLCDPHGVNKPNRFIGYVAETLETLYFMNMKHDLRIAHAGLRFLH